MMVTPTHIFDFYECRIEFVRKKHEIESKYPFEHEKQQGEYEKLTLLGKNYVVEAN